MNRAALAVLVFIALVFAVLASVVEFVVRYRHVFKLPALLVVLGLIGCAGLDDTHRALLLDRITEQGERGAKAFEAAALGKRPERHAELLDEAARLRSDTAVLRSDVAVSLR